MFDMFEVTFEIYVEDKLVNRQIMKAPKEMLMINFIQTMEQLGQDQRPIRFKMHRPEVIWDRFEKKQKTINHEVVFLNNAMIAWEEDKGINNEF